MSGRPRISLIAAMGRNRVIGVDGGLPWHLPGDLKRFKRITMGSPIVMGRKTFESIGRALPGRENIVLSRAGFEAPEGIRVFPSMEAVLEDFASRAEPPGEVFVIGGGQIYRATLPLADRIHLTLVEADPEGDATFPEWDASEFRETGSAPGEGSEPAYRYLTLDRVRNPAS